MDPGCNNKIHFNIMMHRNGNKMRVINFNPKPENFSVGD